MRSSSSAIAAGASVRSTQPRPMAARGMLAKRAVASSCAKVMPPQDLIICMPMAPSVPAPDNTMPKALAPWSLASDSNRSSTGIGGPRAWARGDSFRCPCATVMLTSGGMT